MTIQRQVASAACFCKIVMVPELVAEAAIPELVSSQTELLLPLAVPHARLGAGGRTDTETGSSAVLMVEKNGNQRTLSSLKLCCHPHVTLTILTLAKSSRDSLLPICLVW